MQCTELMTRALGSTSPTHKLIGTFAPELRRGKKAELLIVVDSGALVLAGSCD